MKPARSRAQRRRPYRRSGFHALVAATKRDGLSALDCRSSAARAIRLWKGQVSADLGDDLSAQERTLLDVAAVDMALLSVADAWLIFAQLDDAIRAASPQDACTILGALVEREERLRLRLRTEPALPNGDARESTDENLSAEAAARRLGLSTDFLYRNELPFKVRIGRRVLFSARGLERWNRTRTGR